MFGIGMQELVVILVIALLVLGPKRLPQVARSLGRIMGELRRQTTDIMDEFQAQAMGDEEKPRRPPAPPARPKPPGTPPPANQP